MKNTKVKIEYWVDDELKDFVWIEYDDRNATKELYTYYKSKGLHEALQSRKPEEPEAI